MILISYGFILFEVVFLDSLTLTARLPEPFVLDCGM